MPRLMSLMIAGMAVAAITFCRVRPSVITGGSANTFYDNVFDP
jgi:hypothetical protein